MIIKIIKKSNEENKKKIKKRLKIMKRNETKK